MHGGFCGITRAIELYKPPVTASLPWWSRLGLAFSVFFRILFDSAYAASIAGRPSPEDKSPDRPSTEPDWAAAEAEAKAQAEKLEPPALASTDTGALVLLSLLQSEGRFVDFVQQELAAFSDADIGAAARVVHEGCRRAIRAHARVVGVRNEAEGSTLTLERASEDVKLVGNVAGSAPFRGVLRHRGWRIEQLTLPTVVGAHDPELVAPAELELQ